MCSECGELYTQARYKIVQVPTTTASSQPSLVMIKIEQPAVTQEPAGSPRTVQEETEQPAATQEPAGSPKIVEEETEGPAATQELAGSPKTVEEETEEPDVTQEPAGSPKFVEQEKEPAVTQEPAGSGEEDIEPPRPTQTITKQKILIDAYAQTEPPSVSDACIETSSFQELKGIWRTEYELSQGKAFQQQEEIWFSYAYKNWEALEQSRAQYKEIKKLKASLS